MHIFGVWLHVFVFFFFRFNHVIKISDINSFLFLCSIPLYKYITTCLSNLIDLGYFQLWETVNGAAVNTDM